MRASCACASRDGTLRGSVVPVSRPFLTFNAVTTCAKLQMRYARRFCRASQGAPRIFAQVRLTQRLVAHAGQVKLAAIHYYVWHGPHDPSREQFSLSYLKELRLGEQLMPTPLVTAQVLAILPSCPACMVSVASRRSLKPDAGDASAYRLAMIGRSASSVSMQKFLTSSPNFRVVVESHPRKRRSCILRR